MGSDARKREPVLKGTFLLLRDDLDLRTTTSTGALVSLYAYFLFSGVGQLPEADLRVYHEVWRGPDALGASPNV